VGGLGSPTCFSFHPRKVITTGEGGMITTNDEALAVRARQLRSQGASTSDLERHKIGGLALPTYAEPGFNYRMTDIQGAIGIEQMKRLDHLTFVRAGIADNYDELLAGVEEVETPFVPEDYLHSWQSYLIRLHAKRHRDEILKGMIAAGIPVRHGIAPLHLEPYFKDDPDYADIRLPVTEEASATTMFLPIYPDLTEEQQEYIVDTLKGLLR